MPDRRFRVVRTDHGMAVEADGEPVIYCGWQKARTLTAFLNRWQPTDEQLAIYFAWGTDEAKDYIDRMRRITLRYDSECGRCRQTMPAGARASWDPDTKLVLHGKRCPLGRDPPDAV